MEVHCFKLPTFDEEKRVFVPNPVVVTLTQDTPWANGAYPYTVKYKNVGPQRGATSRFAPDGCEYYTSAWNPEREIAEAKDRLANPNKYDFPQHPNYFETEILALEHYLNSLEAEMSESNETSRRERARRQRIIRELSGGLDYYVKLKKDN